MDEGAASQTRAQEFMLLIVPTVKYAVRCHFFGPACKSTHAEYVCFLVSTSSPATLVNFS